MYVFIYTHTELQMFSECQVSFISTTDGGAGFVPSGGLFVSQVILRSRILRRAIDCAYINQPRDFSGNRKVTGMKSQRNGVTRSLVCAWVQKNIDRYYLNTLKRITGCQIILEFTCATC